MTAIVSKYENKNIAKNSTDSIGRKTRIEKRYYHTAGKP